MQFTDSITVTVPATTVTIFPKKLEAGLTHYQNVVSILKKGFEQEKYRIAQILRSFLSGRLIHEITSVDIARYRDERLASLNRKTGAFISPATVRLEMSLLSNFFDIARIEWGYTAGPNPCKEVRKPKCPPGRERRLTPREERQILRYTYSHSNPELYSIVVLALATAMRQSEILGLRWEYINFRTRVAHLPDTKNGSKRDVPLSAEAFDALTRLGVQTEGQVFTYTANGLKSTWRYMREQLDIVDLHFHDLRHEAISKMFELGTLDMMEIAAISGHKSLSMLKRYTHLRASRLVHKLNGNRNKARQAVIRDLVPYPAVVTDKDDRVEIRFPDFCKKPVLAIASTISEAKTRARDLLLRTLLGMIRLGEKLPAPDEYLDTFPDKNLVIIDPMAMA